jgi:hypothetical protein
MAEKPEVDVDVKKVVDEVKDVVVSTSVTEIDGSTFGCDCGGWHMSLHMTRANQVPLPSKPKVSENAENTSNVQPAVQKE